MDCADQDLRTYYNKTCDLRQYPNALVYFMRQILSGIVYLHKLRIAHRDLKTQNILIIGDTAVIADFGSCQTTEQTDLSTSFTDINRPP